MATQLPKPPAFPALVGMSDSKSVGHLEPKKIFPGVNYLSPEARELVKTLDGRQLSDLSDDEIILLAVTVAQAALAKYSSPATAPVTTRSRLSSVSSTIGKSYRRRSTSYTVLFDPSAAKESGPIPGCPLVDSDLQPRGLCRRSSLAVARVSCLALQPWSGRKGPPRRTIVESPRLPRSQVWKSGSRPDVEDGRRQPAAPKTGI